MRWVGILCLCLCLCRCVLAQDRVVRLKLIETSDVHGNFYPYDFIRQEPAAGSLARVQTFVRLEREKYGEKPWVVFRSRGQMDAYLRGLDAGMAEAKREQR